MAWLRKDGLNLIILISIYKLIGFIAVKYDNSTVKLLPLVPVKGRLAPEFTTLRFYSKLYLKDIYTSCNIQKYYYLNCIYTINTMNVFQLL